MLTLALFTALAHCALPTYDVDDAIVGFGVGGGAAAVMLARAKRSAGISAAALSIAVFEQNSEVGGNVKRVKLQKPPGYDGSFGSELYADEGPARVALMTLGLERRWVANFSMPTECTPFHSIMNARGRRVRCATPNEMVAAEIGAPFPTNATARADAVGASTFNYNDGCTYDGAYTHPNTGAFVGVCDNATDPDGCDAAGNFYNDWLLAGATFKAGYFESDIGGAYDYGGIGDTGTNPLTHDTCTRGDDCPFDKAETTKDDVMTFFGRIMQRAGGAEINYNYSRFLQFDNTGFYRDYEQGNGARGYLQYVTREWGSTNNVYCYPMGGMTGVMLAMKAEFLAKGGKLFLNERVVSVNNAPIGSGFRFYVQTTLRNVRVRQFLIMNTPAWHLFPSSPVDSKVRWGGDGLTGDVITALRAVPELKQPDPHTVIKIVAQWPPGREAWFWRYFDMQTGNYSARMMGDSGCFSRTEFFATRASLCKNAVVLAYSDYQCQAVWQKYIVEAETSGDWTTFTNRLVDEMLSSFPEVTRAEMGVPVTVAAERFPSGWYWGSRNYPNIENHKVTEKAANPLSGKSLCLVGGGYAQSFQGWWEEPLRTVKRCLSTRFGARTPALHTHIAAHYQWQLENILPAFDGGVSNAGYDSSFALIPPYFKKGTVPSQFTVATEHFWPFISPTKPGPNKFCKASEYPAPVYGYSGP